MAPSAFAIVLHTLERGGVRKRMSTVIATARDMRAMRRYGMPTGLKRDVTVVVNAAAAKVHAAETPI